MVVQHYIPISYDSVSDMKSDPMLKEGMIVKTIGYNQPGDMGGSYFKTIDGTKYQDGSYEDNGGSIIDLEESTRLKAIMITEPGTPVSVAQFGAIGDGVHDDYDAIISCLNAFDHVIFGRGQTYYISSPLTDIYKKTIDLNGSTLYTGQDNQILKISEKENLYEEDAPISNDVFVASSIKNGLISIDAEKALSESPIEISDINYNIQFENVGFGGKTSSGYIRNDRIPFLDLSVDNPAISHISFDKCTFTNCGKVAELKTNGNIFRQCYFHDNMYGIDNHGDSNIFSDLKFAPVRLKDMNHAKYAFRIYDTFESSNITIQDTETPFDIVTTKNIVLDNIDITWTDNYGVNKKTEVHCFQFEDADELDTMNIPLMIKNSIFVCTENVDGLTARFSNIESLLCISNNNEFQSVTHYPLPDSLTEIMQIRTDESPKIMSRYSEYKPSDSSIGMVRYRPYWGVARFTSDAEFARQGGFTSNQDITSQPNSFIVQMPYKNYKFKDGSKTSLSSNKVMDVTAYYKMIPNGIRCTTKLEIPCNGSMSIQPNKWYHVCFYVLHAYLNENPNSLQFFANYSNMGDGAYSINATFHPFLSGFLVCDIENNKEKLVRYDYLMSFQTDYNPETSDWEKGAVAFMVMFNSTISQLYGVGQITVTEIDTTYCLNYNFEDLSTVFEEFCIPLDTVSAEHAGNVNFVNVANNNASGFISKDLLLSVTNIPYKRISSIPWIYQSPYYKNMPYNYNLEQVSEVIINPITDGIRVTRRGTATVCGVDLVDFTYQFNYNTTFYLNAEIETNGDKEYDGNIIVFIDNVFRYNWSPENTDKKSFTVFSGRHSVRIFVPLAYNDSNQDLEMTIKNFFITESKNEEIYSVNAIPNTFYKLPLYKNGYIGVSPISDKQEYYTRGQIDVVYASDMNTINSIVDIYADSINISNAVFYDDTLDMYGLRVQLGSTLLPYVSLIPANVTDPTLSWESDSPNICNVIDGYIHGISQGTAILTVRCGNVRTSVFALCQLFPESIMFENVPDSNMSKGDTFQLEVDIYPKNITVETGIIFYSSDTSVLTVSETGLVTCVGPGTAKITASLTETDINNKVIQVSTEEIHVFVPITKITLTKVSGFIDVTEPIINQNTMATYAVNFIPSDTTDIKDFSVEIIDAESGVLVNDLTINKSSGTFAFITTGGGYFTIQVTSNARNNIKYASKVFSRIPATEIQILFNGAEKSSSINYTDTLELDYKLLPSNTTDKIPVYEATVTGENSNNVTFGVIDDNQLILSSTRPGNINIISKLTKVSYTDITSASNEDGFISRTDPLRILAYIESIKASINSALFSNRGLCSTLTVSYTPSFCTEWDQNLIEVSVNKDDVVSVTRNSTPATFDVTSIENGTATIAVSYEGSSSHNVVMDTVDVTVNVVDSHYRTSVFDAEVANVVSELDALSDESDDTFDMVFTNGLFARSSDLSSLELNSLSVSHIANILELTKRVNRKISMVVNGGDLLSPLNTAEAMTNIWNSVDVGPGPVFDKIRPKISYLVGNTDRNDANILGSSTISVEDLYTSRYIDNNATNDSGKGWWYKDNDAQKVRVIGINPHDRLDWSLSTPYTPLNEKAPYYKGFSKDQVEWFVDTALGTVPSNYKVIVVSSFGLHESTAPNYTIASGTNTDYYNADVMLAAITAYKNGSTFAIEGDDYTRTGEFKRYSLNDMSKSFASIGTGDIVIISGGIGYDFYIKIGGIYHITTGYSLAHHVSVDEVGALNDLITRYTDEGYECAGSYNEPRLDEDYGADHNTETEDLFDVIHINNTTDELKLVRFGAGSTRTFTI